ncbi:hypothetical protein [Algoriphagus sp.]|uniref:hypothetical protein n=1 Tax=Algoriphagus sp. TaxID=1872435 RepID=UPI00326FB7D2
MKKKNDKKEAEKEIEIEDWEMSEGMGILPDDVPFTQNIGCVGGSTKVPTKKPIKKKS